jgi:beta-glucosidase
MTVWKLSRRTLLASSLATATVGFVGCTQDPGPQRSPSSSPEPEVAVFGDQFRFGVATSAYQIEGSKNAAGRGGSIWDTFCDQSGKIDDASSGEVACDHYRRWKTDLDLLQQLGIESYRFSIAWPRVLPTGRGAVNHQGLDFYKRLLDGLQHRGIAAVVTLFHWDLPQALQNRGGWENRDCADWFADYAAVLFDALDGVQTWLTINEPKIIVQQGYQLGWMAPGLSDNVAAGRAIHHLGLAHGLAVQALRAAGRPGEIGPVQVLTPVYPADADAADQARVHDVWENSLYLDPIFLGRYPAELDQLDPEVVRGLETAQRTNDLKIISAPVDLIGLNYYSPMVVDRFSQPQQRFPTAANGWQQIHAEGLYEILIRLRNDYDAAVMITESGLPDEADSTSDGYRIEFLRSHLLAVHRALSEGVSVRGFHAWSFLDCFEWARGYTQRWGLVKVDFETQKRTPKESALWYAKLIAERSLPRS